MGVYINMEMPQSCEDCPLEKCDENYYGDESNHRCLLIYKGYTSNNRYEKRRDDCPLVHVPPHGRLIDADEIKTAFPCGESVRTECVRATIDYAPTVIEAEEGE